MDRLPLRALVVVAATAIALSGCTSGTPGPTGTVSPADPATTSAAPTEDPTTAPSTPPPPVPGEPCDPAAGSPDCTDATADSEFRYIEGYAECVASYTSDETYGLCTDLDGDGRAGYPDSG
ncbi:hypothetical protein [Cellulomonas xylanilytica]|nr:hypothetical protein [Cellulomonas xylanilytica]